MSTFSDIKTGYERLGSTADYGLIYTCNAGWLDLGHMNPYNKRERFVGAANLWRQIEQGGPDARQSFWYDYPPDFHALHYTPEVLKAMRDDKRARLPDGSTGFRVTIEMDQPFTGGTKDSFLVRHHLADPMAKSVALSIFVMASYRFEAFQLSLEAWGIADKLSDAIRGKSFDSGFSQEDLVSNLVGFYVGVGEMTRAEALRLAHPVSEATAVAIWNRDGAVGNNKNRSFTPILSENTGRPGPNGQTVDDCTGQPKTFPREFRRIPPATYGANFIRLHPE